MFCPECGEKNNNNARFCGKCGSPLVVAFPGPMGIPGGNGDGNSRDNNDSGNVRDRHKAILIAAVAACLVAVLAALVWLLFFRTSSPGPTPRKDGLALFSDDTQIAVDKDTTLHMRVRAPRDAGDIQIKDDSGSAIATLHPAEMQDSGDGYVWSDVEVTVPASSMGMASYSAESVNGPTGESEKLLLPIVPDDVKPIPDSPQDQETSTSWLLADACDWVDQNLGAQQGEEAAKALADHMVSDSRVSDVAQYGSTVAFTEGQTGVLYCVCLESSTSGMLGASEDHVFMQGGTVLQEFEAYDGSSTLRPGLGITAGNTITNPNVLLLEPTPKLMDSTTAGQVKSACDSYAQALGASEATLKSEGDALRSLLVGDLYNVGLVVIRAHGTSGGAPLLEMWSEEKNTSSTWGVAQQSLRDYVNGLGEGAGDLFCGLASVPEVWRCMVSAHITNEPGVWNYGIDATPYLICNQYSAQPLDECVLWLSACNGLSDGSLESWASQSAHGVQLLVGYSEGISQEEDAKRLDATLEGFVTSSNSHWRCMSAHEVMEGSGGLTTQSVSESTWSGNADMFSKGTSTLAGRVASEDGTGVEGANVVAYRYFNRAFAQQAEVSTGGNGSFEMHDLPSGRYVVVAALGDTNVTATIVLDEEQVDGGTLKLSVETKEAAPTVEISTVDVGVANADVTADSEYYYLGVEVGFQSDWSGGRSQIVRVRRDDESQSDVIWEGSQNTSIGELRIQGNTLIAMVNEADATRTVMTMNKDGSDVQAIGKLSVDSYTVHPTFATDEDCVYYGKASGTTWQILAANFDESSAKVLFQGSFERGDAYGFYMLGIVGGSLYFSIPSHLSDAGLNVVYRADLASGGSATEIMTLGGYDPPLLVGERLYSADTFDFVSYALDGTDRRVITTFSDEVTKSEYPYRSLYNMNSRYALVIGGSSSWCVSLETGEVTSINYYGDDYSMCLVDDTFIASSMLPVDTPAMVCDHECNYVRPLWSAQGVNQAMVSTASASVPSAADQVGAIKASSGEPVRWSNTADYDGDGAQETFALVGGEGQGDEMWMRPSLWFADAGGSASRVTSFDAYIYVNGVIADPAGSGYSLLSLERTGLGSGSSSRVFGVRSGSAQELQADGGEVQLVNGSIACSKSVFRGNGHEFEWFELAFDPSTFRLNQTRSLGVYAMGERP